MPWLRNKATGETKWVDDQQAAPQMPAADPMVIPPDPGRVAREQAEEARKAAAEARANQGAGIAAAGNARASDIAARERAEWLATHNPDGSPKPKIVAADDARKIAQQNGVMDSIVGQINRTQELYNKDIKPEELMNAFGALDAIGPAAGRFNAAGQGVADQGLAAFRVPGQGSQSDYEAKQFAVANTPQAGDWDTQIEEKLSNMRRRVDANRKAVGLPPAQWTGLADQDEAIAAASGIAGAAPVGPNNPGGPPTSGGPTPPPFSPGDQRYQAATGANRAVDDPETASAMDKLVRSGASLEQLNAFGRSKGMMPVNPQEYEAVRDYLRKNPGYQGGLVNAQKYEPLSMFEQGVTAIGDNAAGAYALGAGQFLSGNTLDNMAADPERARLAMGISKAQSPTATTLGEISGGVMAGLTGEAAMARAGMAPGIARGVLADAIAGGANGAGAADNGDRLLGAAKGAAVSGAGSYAGTLASKGIARALAATGGKQAPLYAAGVTPTLGQRVADKGVIGRAINMGEEALQSVPVVGSAIRGARQEARDQFQVGAFNEALKEVGEQLPKGMKPGTDPHAYAQKVFNRAYDEARGGMKLLADEDLKGEIGSLAPDISILGPQARKQLKTIVSNHIDNRMVGGQMGGETYKRTHSDLGKHIARLSKSSMAEDQQLASVLTGVRGALENAARRHSDPEAVQLLDAADAGYAKLVRIEGAAARRGGDDGTFSPAQFSSEVQKASGGVRSKGYLRGDALMQAYAKAGRTLEDKVPNSGTPERQMAAGGLAGLAGYVEPTALTALAGIGAAYAPGARKIMQGALKPAGESRKAIAERLRKRARLIGAGSGSTVGSLLLGTTPSQ